MPYGRMLLDQHFGPESHHAQRALKDKGIESMLEDARNDNQDTDAEHLKRSCTFACDLSCERAPDSSTHM